MVMCHLMTAVFGIQAVRSLTSSCYSEFVDRRQYPRSEEYSL